MATIIQKANNSVAYQNKPLVATLSNGTTAGSHLAVVVEAQKSGYPFNVGSLNANTTIPTVVDNKGNTYTLVRSIVNQTQEVGSSPVLVSPDSAGYFPSLYVFVSTGAVTAGTQSVSVGSFYSDEYASPPLSPPTFSPPYVYSPPVASLMTQGRPVFDGGIQAQVFEVAGVSSLASSSFGSANVAALGQNLLNASGVILEAAILIDSSAIVPASPAAVLEYSGTLYGGSSHFIVQVTTTTPSILSAGFTNSLRYTGAVIAVALS